MTDWTSKNRVNKIRKNAKFEKVDTLPIVRNLVGLGFTEPEIGLVLGVAPSTLASWKSRYPNIFEANKEGKQIMKGLLCAEMFRAATGYEYEEVDETYETPKGMLINLKEGEIADVGYAELKEMKLKKRVVHKKHQPGNTDLQKFLANNLMGDTFPRTPIVVEQNILALIGSVEPDRIRQFAGKLLELKDEPKRIEANVIEDDKSGQPTDTNNG